jgi:hypothetical protein
MCDWLSDDTTTGKQCKFDSISDFCVSKSLKKWNELNHGRRHLGISVGCANIGWHIGLFHLEGKWINQEPRECSENQEWVWNNHISNAISL